MERNSISELQNYAQKNRKKSPEYKVTESILDSEKNCTYFSIMVIFDGETAVGKGLSKKTAKNAAAENLLKILENQLNSKPFTATAEFLHKTKSEVKNLSLGNKNDKSLDSADTDLINGINYIGKLKEYLDKIGGSTTMPEYISERIGGLSHEPEFETLCKFKNIEVKTTGFNKKNSKQKAAKLMYEKICMLQREMPKKNSIKDISIVENDVSVKDLKVETLSAAIFSDDEAIQNQKSMELAKEKYSELTKTNAQKNVSSNVTNNISEYHSFLKNKYTLVIKTEVAKKLKSALNSYSINDLNAKNKLLLCLNSCLERLKINLKQIDYGFSENNNIYLYGLQLDTNPTIAEIDSAETKEEAEIKVIYKMMKTLLTLLF